MFPYDEIFIGLAFIAFFLFGEMTKRMKRFKKAWQ